MAKGYVVRGKNGRGNKMASGQCITLDDAADVARGWREWSPAERPTDVAIFRVLDDGREERLPSYEEALDRLCKLEGALSDAARSPLAALEAAERQLLESARWTPGARGFWVDPDDGTQWPREGAIAAVRRRPEPGAKDGNKQ